MANLATPQFTVACHIGKHKQCDGTGVTERGNKIKCACICHTLFPDKKS